MTQQRWLRIVPVALIMYTISYVDRTNISLALDPKISSMMKDLVMDDEMKGRLAGIFFIGYVLMQIPGGHLASRWSARKLISLCLVAWGICAIGCGLSQSFRQFEVMRFFLGVAESAVFPATLVLLANWFSRSERARANSYWLLCQPLAVAGSAPITGWLLGACGWQQMLILEGMLPFLWLPLWWFFIRDHPRDAKWISTEERDQLETALRNEATDLEPPQTISWLERLSHPSILIMVALYFLHNCAVYGCMTFFYGRAEGARTLMDWNTDFFSPFLTRVTAVVMVLISWHSDKTHERRGHVAAMYFMSGTSLILSVVLSNHFWISVCVRVLGHSRTVRSDGSILGNTKRNFAAKRDGNCYGISKCLWKSGGFVGPLMCWAGAKVNIIAQR